MRGRVCPADGYSLRDITTHDSVNSEWLCTNPWHPLPPGPCPQCGHLFPRAAHLDEHTLAECTNCRSHWQPFAG